MKSSKFFLKISALSFLNKNAMMTKEINELINSCVVTKNQRHVVKFYGCTTLDYLYYLYYSISPDQVEGINGVLIWRIEIDDIIRKAESIFKKLWRNFVTLATYLK